MGITLEQPAITTTHRSSAPGLLGRDGHTLVVPCASTTELPRTQNSCTEQRLAMAAAEASMLEAERLKLELVTLKSELARRVPLLPSFPRSQSAEEQTSSSELSSHGTEADSSAANVAA